MLVRLDNLRKMPHYIFRIFFLRRDVDSCIVRLFSGNEMPVAEYHAGVFVEECKVGDQIGSRNIILPVFIGRAMCVPVRSAHSGLSPGTDLTCVDVAMCRHDDTGVPSEP